MQNSHIIAKGTEVFIVTRDNKILEGYFVENQLFDLVSLNASPIKGSDKQGFTLKNNRLIPNWCEGRKKIKAAYFSKEEALESLKN